MSKPPDEAFDEAGTRAADPPEATAVLQGPATRAERDAWVAALGLDAPMVDDAIDAYCALRGPRSDQSLAQELAILRTEVTGMLVAEGSAAAHAAQLDALVERLGKTLERTALLEAAGLHGEFPELRGRLEAARALLKTARAALARRGRPA